MMAVGGWVVAQRSRAEGMGSLEPGQETDLGGE